MLARDDGTMSEFQCAGGGAATVFLLIAIDSLDHEQRRCARSATRSPLCSAA